MNGIIKNRGINNPDYIFYNDLLADRLEALDIVTTEEVTRIINNNRATMFTWYDNNHKNRIIIYNYSDGSRAGYFQDGQPTGHIYDIDRAASEIAGTAWTTDIFYKGV